MKIFDSVKKSFKTLTGSQEREELLALIQEWDDLLKACTTRIEDLDKGYDFLRKNMFLKRELVAWKLLAVVSAVISLVTLLVVGYWLIKMH
jgi:hypothetical protein